MKPYGAFLVLVLILTSFSNSLGLSLELLQPDEDCESIKKRTKMNIECKDAPETPLKNNGLSQRNPSEETLNKMKQTDINLEEMKNDYFKNDLAMKAPGLSRNPFAAILPKGYDPSNPDSLSMDSEPVAPPSKPNIDFYQGATKIEDILKANNNTSFDKYFKDLPTLNSTDSFGDVQASIQGLKSHGYINNDVQSESKGLNVVNMPESSDDPQMAKLLKKVKKSQFVDLRSEEQNANEHKLSPTDLPSNGRGTYENNANIQGNADGIARFNSDPITDFNSKLSSISGYFSDNEKRSENESPPLTTNKANTIQSPNNRNENQKKFINDIKDNQNGEAIARAINLKEQRDVDAEDRKKNNYASNNLKADNNIVFENRVINANNEASTSTNNIRGPNQQNTYKAAVPPGIHNDKPANQVISSRNEQKRDPSFEQMEVSGLENSSPAENRGPVIQRGGPENKELDANEIKETLSSFHQMYSNDLIGINNSINELRERVRSMSQNPKEEKLSEETKNRFQEIEKAVEVTRSGLLKGSSEKEGLIKKELELEGRTDALEKRMVAYDERINKLEDRLNQVIKNENHNNNFMDKQQDKDESPEKKSDLNEILINLLKKKIIESNSQHRNYRGSQITEGNSLENEDDDDGEKTFMLKQLINSNRKSQQFKKQNFYEGSRFREEDQEAGKATAKTHERITSSSVPEKLIDLISLIQKEMVD